MPTWRRPKGTYTRHTTDWLISQCMIGGTFYLSSTGVSAAIELYNNAADGSSLHVYKVWAGNGAQGPYYFTRQPGTMGGTTVPSYPVVSQSGPGPGVISYADAPAVPFPKNGPIAFPGYIVLQNYAGDTDIVSADGPICVLLPGDSLRGINIAASTAGGSYFAVTFYWAAIRDIG
jgi:hypothetical protein